MLTQHTPIGYVHPLSTSIGGDCEFDMLRATALVSELCIASPHGTKKTLDGGYAYTYVDSTATLSKAHRARPPLALVFTNGLPQSKILRLTCHRFEIRLTVDTKYQAPNIYNRIHPYYLHKAFVRPSSYPLYV